jgi:hypothetical protein
MTKMLTQMASPNHFSRKYCATASSIAFLLGIVLAGEYYNGHAS